MITLNRKAGHTREPNKREGLIMKLLGISFREKISEYAVLERVDSERFRVLETGDLHAGGCVSGAENLSRNGVDGGYRDRW